MTAERGDNAGVRLHVGGLARGVDPNELAALIARTLPSGTASPTAEIMRDASTGIERGFGYVSIPGGEGVKAGAERAIAAYDGARWKGGKIRVGFAKGDYLQRLKAEWDAADAKKEEEASAATATAAGGPSKTPVPPALAYKARPFLRLRRRPGERVVLVDPTPIAWAKPSRKDPRAWNKKEEEGREEGGDGGAHRRKRGVLGARRRVEFPGREATCSTKCRELWRRHLQERAAEASAARLRSVDRMISGQGASASAAAAEEAGGAVVVPNGEAFSRSREATQQSAAAEYLPVEGAADLGPEEPPPSEGIEFVWDDVAEEGSGSGDGVAKEEEEEEEEEEEGEEEEEEEEEEGEEEDEHQPVEDTKRRAAAVVTSRAEEEEEKESVEGRGEDSHRDPPPPVSPAAAAASASATGSTASKRLERLGEKHGVELDDRLAELLSDGSDDDDGGVYGDGGYDYELETAKRAGAASEAAAAGEGTVVGMRERLQAETERSLGVLAAIFGGGSGNATAGGAPPPPTAAVASSSTPATSGAESRGPECRTVVAAAAAAAAADDKPAGEAMAAASLPVPGGETAATEGLGGGSGNSAGEESERGSRDEEEDAAGGGGGGGGGAGHQDGGGAGEEERFVAHMSALTDIFTVKDKVSTKKNREEKDKDKGFKITSLFDAGLTAGAAEAEAGAGAGAGAGVEARADPRPAGGNGVGGTGGLFSFGFGGEGAGAPAAAAGDGGTGAVPVEGQARPAASLSSAAATTVAAAVSDGGDAGGESQPGGTLPVSGGGGGGAVVVETALWRPLGEVVAVAARFMRTGKREDVEAAWLGERRALTQDFKRKHKDAVKGRRGAAGGGHPASKKRRR